jgi:hypothetical protein
MTLKNYFEGHGKYFIAMEYYALILNRTFMILLDKNYLIGIKVHGIVASKGEYDWLTGINYSAMITKPLDMVVEGPLETPHTFINHKFIDKIMTVDILSDGLLAANKSNFRIAKKDIKDIYHNPKKKWGMGEYIHDGKIYIKTIDEKKREFIILGHQSGNEIVKWILQ